MMNFKSLNIRERTNTWTTTLNDIKERLKNQENEEINSKGIREVILYHGLKIISSTTLLEDYLDICYCDNTQEYLVLSDKLIVYRYSIQGIYISPPFILTSSMVFTKFIWCPNIQIFVCYVPDDDLIKCVNAKFKIIETIKNEFKIKEVVYLAKTNEIIVIGPTIVTKYSMAHLDVNSYHTMHFIDETAGPFWTLQQSCLIKSEELILAGSYLTTIYLISLTPNEDHHNNVRVKFSEKKLNASTGSITALYYHSASQWIISGDQLGTVSAWTLNLDCIFTCINGHRGIVTMIIAHPSISGFITSSEDNVLQVWSCNLREKIEKFVDFGAVSSMAINKYASSIVTLGVKLNFFVMQQLYTFYSPLTAPAVILFSANKSLYPTRIVVMTSDNTISILSSASGRQLNVQVLPATVTPLSIACSAVSGCIYMVGSEKRNISVSNTQERPMRICKVWPCSQRKITCIIIYDHYDEIHGAPGRNIKERKSPIINPIRARLIAGTQEGELVLLDETTGEYDRTISAHDGPIKKLHASMLSRHVVSVGEDKCVKIWRVLPDIAAALALIHCIYYTSSINDLTCMGFVICTVSSTINSELHQLFMYNIKERSKLEHHYSKDHTGYILAIASSESIHICATSSVDGTIRVWDRQNFLLKILEVNISAKAIAFSSLRGDIIFSAGKHLYRIPHVNYLPPKYRTQIITNDIVDENEESPMPTNDESYTEYEINEDKFKALHPVNSIPLGSLDPTLDAPRIDLMLQNYICGQLKSRDEDIIQIKNGALQAKKIVKKKALMSDNNWQKYLDVVINGVTENIEQDFIQPHDIWKSIAKYINVKKIPNISRFYDNMNKNMSDQTKITRDMKLLKPFVGFIPNSVIVKITEENNKTSPAPKICDKKIFKYIYPPEVETEPNLIENSNLFTLSQLEGLNLSLDLPF